MRFLLIVFSILTLLVVGALIGPSFVDWNKYKDQITTQVANATGLEMTIAGDLSLAVLPSPRVSIEDLSVKAPQSIRFDNLVTLKEAEVSVALLPLLQKQVQISSVTLIEPDIQVEIMADGTPSWTTDKIKKVQEVSGITPDQIKQDVSAQSSNALEGIALDQLTIEKGKIAFIDHQKNSSYALSDIHMTLGADTLKGPFNLEGDFIYDGKKIALEGNTGRLPKAGESLEVKMNVALPERGAEIDFNGLAAIQAPFDAQGQTSIRIDNPSRLAKMFGSTTHLQESISLNGLLSANEDKIQYNDLKLSLGNFVGDGNIKIENLKAQNPLNVVVNVSSKNTLDLDPFLVKTKKERTEESVALSGGKAVSSNAFVPKTLALPMDINAAIQMDLAGVQFDNKSIKGAFIDLEKKAKNIKATVKAMDLPGDAKTDAVLAIAYASLSKSDKTGVVYSDPDVTFAVNGQVGNIAQFMKAFAPDVDAKVLTQNYKTANINLNGKVSGAKISVKDSTIKLDQNIIGIGGNYEQPASGRAKAFIDISANEIDFDKFSGKTAQSGEGKSKNTGSTNTAESVKPLQEFSLPLDLGFDVSIQKARLNQQNINGVRVTGDLTGQKLTLKNASVNDFVGANIGLKGQIANLAELSGIDLTLNAKTQDVQGFAAALNVDTTSFPKDVKSLEASVSGKGTTKSLGFDANIKSMGGQLDVKGNATDLLGSPSYNNLSIGLTHPNLVKAIQIVSPEFKGQAGLDQPINFRSNATIEGKKIDFNNMSVKLGKTDFDGNLNIDASNKITSIRGTIQAGEIALDELLGVNKSSASRSSGGGSSSSAPKSSGRWSKDPIDLGFMNTMDIDIALSAGSITYGAWNFTRPSTTLRIANGQMSVNDMKAGVFGGQANLSTTVKSSPVSLDLSSAMNNIDLDKLARALSGSGKLRSAGTVNFDMDVRSTGSSAHALINALNGKANLDGQDVTLIGFDLAKLARGLAVEEKLAVSALSLVDGAMSGGQTKFDTVKGEYNINNGVVNITSMVMDSAEARIDSTGSADLPKWFINVDNKITLKNVTDLEPFEVKIKGPLDNPTDTFGKNILEDYIQDKVRRKIGKELPGILGDDATNMLQQFGIIPKNQAPAPAAPAAPANDNTAPAEAQPVAPAQEESPKKIEKPEDAVKEILRGGDPEEAINNVIRGLF